jgi:hypothetical protein
MELLSASQVASLLGVTEQALAVRRRRGTPPKYIKENGRILYEKSEVDNYAKKAGNRRYSQVRGLGKLLTVEELTERTNFTKEELEQRRKNMKEPRWVVMPDGEIRYRYAVIMEWLERRERMLTPAQARDLTGVSPAYLANLRKQGKLPIFTVYGGRVKYKYKDIADWVEKSQRLRLQFTQKNPAKEEAR